MGIKPKTSFRHFITTRCSRWLAVLATHIPRRPKKKPLRGKKVGFAEKKRAYRKKWRTVCIKGGMSLPEVTCHNRGSSLWLRRSPSFAFRLHGVVHDKPSPIADLRLASRSPGCAFRLYGVFHNTPSPMAGFL